MFSFILNTGHGGRRGRSLLRAGAWSAAAIGALLAANVAAQPFPVTSCAADRGLGHLNCTANDIEIASVTVNNGVTTCRAGDPVTLDLTLHMHVNAQDRHDIGVFLAKDGKSPMVPSASGGSASCAVFGVPFTPVPWANLDGNACGDFDRDGLPQGTTANLEVGLVTLTCVADQNGNLVIPSLISWDTGGTATSCQAPPPAWVRPGSPSKCEAGITATIPVQVQGRIAITKQTNPDASPGTFAFTATGTGVTPGSFTLTDNQTTTLTTGILTSSAQTYTITEAALGGFDPTAQIVCVDKDGDARPEFVTINNAARTVSIKMSASGIAGLPEVACTFTNTRAGSITIVKNTVGGNGTFNYTGSQSFAITTAGGTGQTTLSNLAPGTYSVTETVPTGWEFTSLTCVDPSGGTTTAGPTASIALAAGENVTCTYVNTARGTINISKATTGGDGTFNFTGPTSFQITTSGGAGGPYTYSNLAAGTYTISETVPAGWDLTSITCTDPSGGTVTSGNTATIALAAGETVSCTFNDRKRASIVVEKATVGGDGTFAFTGAQSFSITTTGGTGSNTTAFASVTPGTAYAIAETVPAGWTLQSAACRDAGTGAPVGSPITNGVTVTPTAGQGVICTFSDQKLATLRIYKHSQPHGAQTFAFTATNLTPNAFNLTDDGVNANFVTFANVPPGSNGTYVITEAAQAGWVLTALTCSDVADPDPTHRSTLNLTTRTVDAHLAAGEVLDCTFTNTQIQPGSITVTKHSVGGDGTFPFANSGGIAGSATNPAAFSITTSGANHVGAQQLTGLAAGNYTITETVPAGWDLAPPPVNCTVTSGSNTTIVQVTNGVSIALGTTGLNIDAVACEFTDVKRASITITKQANPHSTQAFTFATTSSPATTPLPATFQVTDSGTPPNAQTFGNLVAGHYTIAEAATAGWNLLDIACTGASGITTNLATGQVGIDLQPGSAVECTYTNAQNGTIAIKKIATGGSGTETFTFVGAVAGAIGNGGTLSGQFAPGTYSVTEVVPAGWTLANIACSGASVEYSGAGGGGTPSFQAGDTTVGVTLAGGEAAVCTFANQQQASITIVKKSLGGDATFTFGGARSFQIKTTGGTGQDSTTFAAIKDGMYPVTEIVPPGYKLTDLTCSNHSVVNLATATANVEVAPGEHVTCTFTDARQGTITITKRIGGDATANFEFSVPASLDPSGKIVLAPPIDVATASRTFTNVAPGSYRVAERGPPAGWRFTGLTCNGSTVIDLPAQAATINLGAGDAVECIFDNVTYGEIIISVVSVGGTDTFAFTSSGLAPTFSLTTPAENVKASREWTNLLPGTYVVNGLGAPGWEFIELTCTSDGGESYWSISGQQVTIAFSHGEEIECTYYYRKGVVPPPITLEPIPTLGEYALAALALLLAAMAAVTLRRRGIG